MINPELRPLSLAELLDRVFTLYKSYFWLFVGIMLVPSLLIVPMNLIMFGAQLPFMRRPAAAKPLAGMFLLAIFVVVTAFWVLHTVALAATTHAVSEVYLGRASTVRGAYGRIRGRFWRLMLLLFGVALRIVGLLFLMGMSIGILGAALGVLGKSAGTGAAVTAGLFVVVLFIGFGILVAFVMLRYAVCIPAMMIENIKAAASIRRSVELTKGRRWQIFAGALLAILLSYVAAMIFEGPFWLVAVMLALKGQGAIWLAGLTTLSGAIGGAISSPIFTIVLVLFYYDLRVRKEGFDLELLMSSLGTSGTASAAAPSV